MEAVVFHEPEIDNNVLLDDGLVDFFRHGIHSQSWTLFDKPSNARMCYIGTSLSNMSHLVRTKPWVDASGLHYPIPQIRRIVSWDPRRRSPRCQVAQPDHTGPDVVPGPGCSGCLGGSLLH
jgi:hypothetical protein